MIKKRQVFLSHSSIDAALARRLTIDLIDLGAEVWLDQFSLGVGEDFVDGIEAAIAKTDLMLVLVSEESLASGWVQFEWRRLGVAGGRVLPLRLVDCEMPDELSSQGFIDVAGGAYWRGIAQIAERMGIRDARPTVVRTPDVLPLPTPIKVDLGAEASAAFRDFARADGLARAATQEMRERVQRRSGLLPPSVRFVGDVADMPAPGCLISVEDIPKDWFEVEDASNALETVIARLEDVILTNLDRFIDPDSRRDLYAPCKETEGSSSPVATGELTAIFRETARQGMSLRTVGPLEKILSAKRPGPLDIFGVVEELRPYQNLRLSKKAVLDGEIRALTLDPELETYAAGRLMHLASGTRIDLPPEWVSAVWQRIRATAKDAGASTLIVENPSLRRYFERLQMGELMTLARRDVHPDARVRVLGAVSLDEASEVDAP